MFVLLVMCVISCWYMYCDMSRFVVDMEGKHVVRVQMIKYALVMCVELVSTKRRWVAA